LIIVSVVVFFLHLILFRYAFIFIFMFIIHIIVFIHLSLIFILFRYDSRLHIFSLLEKQPQLALSLADPLAQTIRSLAHKKRHLLAAFGTRIRQRPRHERLSRSYDGMMVKKRTWQLLVKEKQREGGKKK
jgi:hypothetical protein